MGTRGTGCSGLGRSAVDGIPEGTWRARDAAIFPRAASRHMITWSNFDGILWPHAGWASARGLSGGLRNDSDCPLCGRSAAGRDGRQPPRSCVLLCALARGAGLAVSRLISGLLRAPRCRRGPPVEVTLGAVAALPSPNRSASALAAGLRASGPERRSPSPPIERRASS